MLACTSAADTLQQDHGRFGAAENEAADLSCSCLQLVWSLRHLALRPAKKPRVTSQADDWNLEVKTCGFAIADDFFLHVVYVLAEKDGNEVHMKLCNMQRRATCSDKM